MDRGHDGASPAARWRHCQQADLPGWLPVVRRAEIAKQGGDTPLGVRPIALVCRAMQYSSESVPAKASSRLSPLVWTRLGAPARTASFRGAGMGAGNRSKYGPR